MTVILNGFNASFSAETKGFPFQKQGIYHSGHADTSADKYWFVYAEYILEVYNQAKKDRGKFIGSLKNVNNKKSKNLYLKKSKIHLIK